MAVLLARFGSFTSPVIVVVLSYTPVARTVATITNVSDAPFKKFPIVHVGDTQLPTDGVALTIEYPEGMASVTTTFVALSGPRLSAVMVNVTLAPTAGVADETVFVTAKSAMGADMPQIYTKHRHKHL